ncbi:MAG TPA: NAD-dependent epimerase/dehydratase family protein, partial [Pyrinomonadaceae bacterium]|nr:NAD-dependent epimerase/dehydratase family protein [Pyrinomonadaceae bacterium]
MTKKYQTALVGCGRISAIHIDALKALSDLEVVAVCDLSESLARERALQYNIPGVFTDLETLVQEVRPDVLHILTPPRSHLPLAKIAAKYGVHMYIEKPLASNEADALAILQLAREAGVQICPGHNRLYEPFVIEAWRRIRAGEIGRVVSVRVEQGFTYEAAARSATIPWSYTYDWGIFENLICHPLYLATSFLKEPGQPQVVGLNLDVVREAAVEEIRVIIPSKDAIGEVMLSLTTPEVNRLEIIGTCGRIIADFNALTIVSTTKNGLPSVVNRFTANFSMAMKLTRASLSVAFGIVTGRVKQYMGLKNLVEEFYRSLHEGLPPPISPEQGLLNVRQMDQIKKGCQNVIKQRLSGQAVTEEAPGPRVLVTGATGFLGGRLVERLSADGVSVRATTRLMSRARPLSGIQWVRCDLAKEDELRNALAGMETVFHCAAMAGPPGSLKEYEEANVEGTLNLAKLGAQAGVRNFVYVSSLSVYENPRGRHRYLNESTAYDRRAADRGSYSQSKLRADKALLEYATNGTPASLRIVVMRPGTIYGPGAPLPIGRLQLTSSNRRPIIAGSHRVPMPLTYVDNLIDAMLAAAGSHT